MLASTWRKRSPCPQGEQAWTFLKKLSYHQTPWLPFWVFIQRKGVLHFKEVFACPGSLQQGSQEPRDGTVPNVYQQTHGYRQSFCKQDFLLFEQHAWIPKSLLGGTRQTQKEDGSSELTWRKDSLFSQSQKQRIKREEGEMVGKSTEFR